VGNVYCAHNISIGNKTIRKLDPNGNEVWSKTDVAAALGVAVDSAGNVYCAHNDTRSIRKLDPNGNEVWSKTDVASGRDVAVDSVGNVFAAHNVSSGKAIRKLDGKRYYQITG
jgi:DNA-binding beta-propeller fold protein YncE